MKGEKKLDIIQQLYPDNEISDEILQKVDWNQFEHVARNLTNMCQIVRTHPFECDFWSTPICAKHAH